MHYLHILKQSPAFSILALATILGFEVWSLDVKQAYLHSASKLQQKIFTSLESVEFGINELLQVIRPLYGLSDSGDYWCETNSRFNVNQLRLQQSTVDFTFSSKRLCNRPVAVFGSYVDHIVQARI